MCGHLAHPPYTSLSRSIDAVWIMGLVSGLAFLLRVKRRPMLTPLLAVIVTILIFKFFQPLGMFTILAEGLLVLTFLGLIVANVKNYYSQKRLEGISKPLCDVD